MKQCRCAIWVALLILLLADTAQAASDKIRVLLLDGESGGPYHNWQLITPILKFELEETGLFAVTVATALTSKGDLTAFKPEFAKYQVVVSNLDSPQWPDELRSEFETFVRNGGGFVVVHAADNAFPDWSAYNQMTGIGGWRGRNEKTTDEAPGRSRAPERKVIDDPYR
jgi:hypothetical protein